MLERTISLNLAVLLLPIGIGLLKGKSSSIVWAKRWIFLAYFSFAVITVIALLFQERIRAAYGSDTVPLVLAIVLILTMLHYLMQKALSSEKVTSYIAGRYEDKVPDVPKDDMSMETKCLQCGNIIPIGKASCRSCGWTYKLKQETE